MKKFFLSFASLSIMVAMACLLAVSVSSCGDDDNDTPTPSASKGTTMNVQPAVYVSANTLKYFNVTLTDANGNNVQLTEQNTEKVSVMDFGYCMQLQNTGKSFYQTITDNGDEVRLYKSSTSTFKSFPSNMSFKVNATLNGTVPEDGKMNLIVLADVKLTTDASAMDGLNISSSQNTTTGINYNSYIAKYTGKTVSVDLTVNSANSVTGSVKVEMDKK